MSDTDLSKLRIDRSRTTPSAASAPRRGLLVGVATFAGLIFLYFLSRTLTSETQTPSASPSRSDTVVAPLQAPPASVLNATGYVVAQRKAAVSSKATGRLRELRVVEGDTVTEGQVIGVIENEDLVAAVDAQEANLALLKTRITWSEAELEEAQANRIRMEASRKTNAVSQSDLDQAVARHKKAIADLESARLNVQLAEAQLQGAKVDLGYTYIVAPFDGTVLTKNADVGEIVAPFGSSTNARAAVVTIADMSSLQVEADVSESNITKIHVGQDAEITLDSFPGKTYRGVVEKIVPTVDRAKATVLTKIKFLDRDDHVLPEMSAKVAFQLSKE